MGASLLAVAKSIYYARSLNVKVSAGVATTATTTRKSKKLNRQNNNSSRFFVHFFPVTYDYIREMPNFTFYGGRRFMKRQLNFLPLSF